MSFLPLFRDLDKLLYVKTDAQGSIIEHNTAFERHTQLAGQRLFSDRDMRRIRAAAARAIRADWGLLINAPMQWINGEHLNVRVQILHIEGEFVFLGWELNPDDRAKLLRELAWIMSHVIRKPAANLLGLLPMIERTADNITVLDYMQQSVRELDAGIRMVSDVIVSNIPDAQGQQPLP